MLTGYFTQGNEYATYTYPDGRERHTVNGREQIEAAQKHAQPQRVHLLLHRPPPPIQTSAHLHRLTLPLP
jgi:hypothetical protein